MSEERRREYDEDQDIPRWLKWTFTAINRVGFPVVAFFFMWYLSTVSLKKFSDALERQSLSLEALIITVNGNHAESKEWRSRMSSDMKDIERRLH